MHAKFTLSLRLQPSLNLVFVVSCLLETKSYANPSSEHAHKVVQPVLLSDHIVTLWRGVVGIHFSFLLPTPGNPNLLSVDRSLL